MARRLKTLFFIALVLFVSNTVSADFSREYIDQYPLHSIEANNIQLSYRMIGSPEDPIVVMVMGLGASHAVWGDGIVKGIEDAGFQVLIFDNRDVGGSTRFDEWGDPVMWWQLLKYAIGLDVDAPYNLYDMAGDTVSLMDALNIKKAHIVGASMGGMIAQIVAARHPNRANSLISIMSTTNAPHLPRPSSGAENSLRDLADGEAAEAKAEAMRQRGFSLESMPRQIMSILKTGDRTREVATITSPTLVIHGEEDMLLQLAHGQHTAETIVGSKLVTFENMGHNIPKDVLPKLLNSMIEHLKYVESIDSSRAVSFINTGIN